MSFVQLRSLTKRFEEKVAVDDVSIDVRKNEFLTLLGPSGCGKTTTLRLVAGFIRPDEGEITVGERLLASAQKGVFVPASRRGMGMVFQSYAVWPHMTVFDNVAYGLKIKKTAKSQVRKRVTAALEMVRLSGFEKRTPPQLSGGEQQRVALARALVTEPEILLFDEPLSNLDAKLREEMRFEIRDLQKKLNITAIYVTHDQAEAMVMSDRIAVMDQGRIHQVGSPYEIYRSPADQFVAGFIGLANFFEGHVKKLGEKIATITLETGTTISIPCQLVLAPEARVLVSIRPEEIEITDSDPKKMKEGSIEARVERTAFLGSVVDLRVSVEGKSIRVQSKPPPRFRVGDAVLLNLNPAECRIVSL